MVNITKETYEANGIEVIKDNLNNLWLNERHVETQLRLTNLPTLTSNYIKKYNGYKEYKKQRSELNISTKQPNRRFTRVKLVLKVIMICKTDESCNLKRNLGFTLHDVINTKEQTVINSIKDAFEKEDMNTQYSVLSYMIDLYFHKHKLAIEVDELGHADRNFNNEIERQRALERELNCVFIRIDPDVPNFNIFREINKIHRHINKLTEQQTKKQTKKSIIDNLSKGLLELEFKHDSQIKTRCLKRIVKNILPNYKLEKKCIFII